MQDEVTYSSTLDASRLKLFFRSVDSDSDSISESTSERKKTRLHFFLEISKKNRFEEGIFLENFISKKNFRKTVQFPRDNSRDFSGKGNVLI